MTKNDSPIILAELPLGEGSMIRWEHQLPTTEYPTEALDIRIWYKTKKMDDWARTQKGMKLPLNGGAEIDDEEVGMADLFVEYTLAAMSKIKEGKE